MLEKTKIIEYIDWDKLDVPEGIRKAYTRTKISQPWLDLSVAFCPKIGWHLMILEHDS